MTSLPLLVTIVLPIIATDIGSPQSFAPLPNGDRIAEVEINSQSMEIDPIVTGQTSADTEKDWEKRNSENQACPNCTEINPFPLELED